MKLDQSSWPPDRIAALETDALERLRQNASRHNMGEVVQRCSEELDRRNARKTKPASVSGKQPRHPETVVVGYHFVCKADRGVVTQIDGRFRTGSWVVSQDEVERSLTAGAYLALHESKLELSYRQGRVVGFALTERDMLQAEPTKPQTRFGIEFLVEATNDPYEWVGDGAGEKGYKWAPLNPRVSS